MPDKLREFEIKGGETTVLGFGSQFTVRPNPVKEGENLVVNIEVWGQNGERFFPYCLSYGGNLDCSAKIAIFDEEGNEVRSGGVEYG